MNSEKLNDLFTSIHTKLGDEANSIIADDLGSILTLNEETLKNTNNLNNEIKQLKENNEKLTSANANLLKQIPVLGDTIDKKTEDENTKPKSTSFKEFFDEKGNFKK